MNITFVYLIYVGTAQELGVFNLGLLFRWWRVGPEGFRGVFGVLSGSFVYKRVLWYR